MKRIFVLVFGFIFSFLSIPSVQADCLVWNEHGNCIQEEVATTEDPAWQQIRREFENDPQYDSVRYQVDSTVFTYNEAERAALLNQWATNTLRQRSNDAARNEVQTQILQQANANPGQEVCGTWISGSGSGGTCITIPLAAKSFDAISSANKIAEIRARLEADPQYSSVRYQVDSTVFTYSPAERAALLDQWAKNMAGGELAKEAATKKAVKNPGLRVCSDWTIGDQSGQQCDYVPVAITSAAILSSVKQQLDGLDLSTALDNKINKFVKVVDNAIPNTINKKSVTIPKTPKGLSQVVSVENPDECSAKGRKVNIKKGAMCEISIDLKISEEVIVNFSQTVTRR